MKKSIKLVAGAAALVLVAGGALSALGTRSHPGATGHDDAKLTVSYPDDGVQSSIQGSLTQGSLAQPDVASKTAAIAPAPGVPPVVGSAVNASPASAASAPAPLQSSAEAARSSVVSGSGTGAPAAGATDGTLSSADVGDRKVVQTASVNLQVKDVGGSFAEIGQIATSVGGFVAGSNFSLQGDSQIATATIRVPATRYQDVLGQIRALGVKVEGETSNASDVTQEYSDLDARVRTLQATQAQLLQLLSQTRTINETLQVQDRLNTTQNQIEQSKGRMLLLDKLSDLATLTVHLRPVVVVEKAQSTGVDLGAKVDQAWSSSLDFLGAIAAGVLTVIVFGWWIPLIALPAFMVLRRFRSHPLPKPVQAYD